MDAAFFDLDGCLVDSREAISSSINQALVALGLQPQPPASLHTYIGPPLLGTMETLLTAQGADPARARDAITAYREDYVDGSARLTELVLGIPEALSVIAAAMPMRVVTSKPAGQAKRIVAALGLDPLFDAVHGPDPEALEEPKRVKLREALEQAGITADRRQHTVMVGDRHHDIDAGRACGTRTVGVLWGIGDQSELAEAGADHLVATPAELPALLLGQTRPRRHP